MSETYQVSGWVDVRVFFNDESFSASSSATAEDIAEIVTFKVSCLMGRCEIVNHLLQIEGLAK